MERAPLQNEKYTVLTILCILHTSQIFILARSDINTCMYLFKIFCVQRFTYRSVISAMKWSFHHRYEGYIYRAEISNEFQTLMDTCFQYIVQISSRDIFVSVYSMTSKSYLWWYVFWHMGFILPQRMKSSGYKKGNIAIVTDEQDSREIVAYHGYKCQAISLFDITDDEVITNNHPQTDWNNIRNTEIVGFLICVAIYMIHLPSSIFVSATWTAFA